MGHNAEKFTLANLMLTPKMFPVSTLGKLPGMDSNHDKQNQNLIRVLSIDSRRSQR